MYQRIHMTKTKVQKKPKRDGSTSHSEADETIIDRAKEGVAIDKIRAEQCIPEEIPNEQTQEYNMTMKNMLEKQ